MRSSQSSVPDKDWEFSSSHRVWTYQVGIGGFFPMAAQLVHEADHAPKVQYGG